MLNVLFTVDTELSTGPTLKPNGNVEACILRDIYGRTCDGSFGVSYQIECLNRNKLKGVFFIDPFFTFVTGMATLRHLVDEIQSNGHEAQVHLHTEWLDKSNSLAHGNTGFCIKDFQSQDQSDLIGNAITRLHEAGAKTLSAFRAGNFGASFVTLQALAKNHLQFDSSYNPNYLASTCDMNLDRTILGPEQLHGVIEIPNSVFFDYPGHLRALQLCACSSEELEYALLQAFRLGWTTLVIVSHSFELIYRDPDPTHSKPVRIVIERFERLCKFLAAHPDKFRSCGYNDLSIDAIHANSAWKPIHSNVWRTAKRLAEQAAKRLS